MTAHSFPKFEDILLNPKNDFACNKSFYDSISTAEISASDFKSNSRYPELCYAPFGDIRNLFKSDKHNFLKRAPKFTANLAI